MAFEQRDNSGALFKNDKGGVETRPDYKGKALIDGVENEISAWIKKDRNGKPFMSLSFREIGGKETQEKRQEKRSEYGDAYAKRRDEPYNDSVSDIPF